LNNEHGTRFKINMSKTLIRLPDTFHFFFRFIVVTVKRAIRNIPNEFALNNTTPLYNIMFSMYVTKLYSLHRILRLYMHTIYTRRRIYSGCLYTLCGRKINKLHVPTLKFPSCTHRIIVIDQK